MGCRTLILVTELTVRCYRAKFISKFGCDAQFGHNQNLLFYQRKEQYKKPPRKRRSD